jgi:hypothetical protein
MSGSLMFTFPGSSAENTFRVVLKAVGAYDRSD